MLKSEKASIKHNKLWFVQSKYEGVESVWTGLSGKV